MFDSPAANLGGRTHDRQCYDYDGLGRLVEAWTPATAGCGTAPSSGIPGGAAAYWHSYSHDSVGNRTSVVEHAVGSGTDTTSTYDYPEAGGAAGTQPHGVTQVQQTGAQPGTSAFEYDAVGNMTGRDQAGQALQELSWDAEGELAAVAEDADGDGTISAAEQDEADGYVYTADGERILRTQDGATTLYLGHQELTLDHGTGTVSGQRYYTFGGMTIATRTGYNFADVDTIISDQQGTGTVQIPNVDGPAQRVHRYTDPYGKPRGPQASQPGAGGGADGDWTGEHGFLDKPVDATGLTAIGARMYDPTLGRFVSVDPVMDLTDPQQWNGYAYSHNNPTTFTDPTGMRELCETGYTCNYGKGGSITKAKKKPKPKPTIWDIRSRVRYSYTLAQPWQPLPSTTPYYDAAAARREVAAAKLALARANAAAARARVEQARQQAKAAAAARLREQRRMHRGTPTGAALGDLPSAFIVHQNGPYVGTGITLDDYPDQVNIELYAGGCEGLCVDGAVGFDTKEGFYRSIAPGFGIETGFSAGLTVGNGIVPGISYGASGSANVYGPFLMTGSTTFTNPPGISGGGGIGGGMRYGGHVYAKYTRAQ
ncbi:RHS repeat-associated core domain-containing protein [Myceligenerans salitolerans]|uniref:RHS repeat-associated core domain-containing protein n=1 Tax=Myceligenerans salitolerans TaxID=1230528 RepID=A0ABS3IBN3_9MICO|nr:RHS repeat-associated core domain-containing protein [Myceligenerans salitolerans]MBO0609853.1 hypothetical protein [Myceligenerans salitolerans]